MDTIVKKTKKYIIPVVLIVFFCIGRMEPVMAQSDYERLARQKDRPQIHFTVFTLPGENKDRSKLTTTFQLSNSFLPFRKVNNANGKEKFFSTAALNLEVFKSPEKIRKPSRKKRWQFEQIDVDGLESVGRDTWKDTAYAETYKETKSNDTGLNGSMQVDLTPGYYTYLVQLNREDQPNIANPRRGGDSNQIRNSQTRSVYVPSYDSQRRNNLILVKKVNDAANPSRLELINMGDNVTYGQDFYAFIHLPEFKADKKYSLQINRIEAKEKDTTQISNVYENEIAPDQIIHNIVPKLQSSSANISLILEKQNNGYNYALIKIPNAKYPNAVYRLTVRDNSNQPVARDIFRSYWSDIPTSLLSLDVAIDMLHYITNDETIKKINDGSDREREQKFRKFWKDKDPTPNTEFNELEAEYYRRIDYAYDNFGSQNIAGYKSDRGKIYINYGPPQDIKRTFPTDGPTTEVWTYKSRSFVFKATSGFGDFKLVKKNKSNNGT